MELHIDSGYAILLRFELGLTEGPRGPAGPAAPAGPAGP